MPSAGAIETDVTLGASYSAADGDAADVTANGEKSDSQRKSGEGSVTVVLMPKVKVGGLLMVQGVRPGIDGAYRISSVSHRLDRSSGGVTTIELKQPGRGTGAKGDTRKSGLEEEVDRYSIAHAPAIRERAAVARADQAVGDAAKRAIDDGRAT